MMGKSGFFGPGRPTLQDRIDIEDLICAVTMYADCNEYEQLLNLFAEDGVMKYGALFGAEHNSQPAATFIAHVRSFMPGFDSTQHQVTNFDIRVYGDSATSRSQVKASHRLGNRDWVVASIYHHEFVRRADGWRISSMGVQPLFEDGDRAMVEEAARRVAARIRRETHAV